MIIILTQAITKFPPQAIAALAAAQMVWKVFADHFRLNQQQHINQTIIKLINHRATNNRKLDQLECYSMLLNT